MDATPQRMPWLAILQVSLVNLAVALITLPLGSTLNRIMIADLALPATLVALLLALGNITSPLRIWFGRLSDTRPIGGLRRTWYIVFGVMLCAAGLAAAPAAISLIPTNPTAGLLLTVLAFALVGFGVNSTTPLYFALVSDQASEAQRPRIVSFMFVLLGVGVVIASFAIGALLEPYSPARLIVVIGSVALLGLLLAAIGLFRLEKPAPAGVAPAAREAGFGEVRALLTKNGQVLRFFVYLVLTFVAIDAQDVILEPFAAFAFGMSAGETARLTGIFRGGFLLTLIAGAWAVGRFGYRRTAATGITIAATGLALIIGSGFGGAEGLFLGSVFLFGLGSGFLTIANLSLMMFMTDPAHAGVYIGTWGFAQAVGVGAAALVGGIIRDSIFALSSGNQILSFVTVFGLEIVLLAVAVPFLLRLDVERFRELSTTIAPAQVIAGAARQG